MERLRKPREGRVEVLGHDSRDQTFGIHPAHQFDEFRAPASRLDHGVEESREHLFDRHRPAASLGLKALQLGQPPAVHRRRLADNQLVQQILFRSEMIMDRRQIDTGLRDDVPKRCRRIALIGDEPFGGVQDLLFRINHSIKSSVLIVRMNVPVSRENLGELRRPLLPLYPYSFPYTVGLAQGGSPMGKRSGRVAERLMATDCKSVAPWSYGGSNPPPSTRGFRRLGGESRVDSRL